MDLHIPLVKTPPFLMRDGKVLDPAQEDDFKALERNLRAQTAPMTSKAQADVLLNILDVLPPEKKTALLMIPFVLFGVVRHYRVRTAAVVIGQNMTSEQRAAVVLSPDTGERLIEERRSKFLADVLETLTPEMQVGDLLVPEIAQGLARNEPHAFLRILKSDKIAAAKKTDILCGHEVLDTLSDAGGNNEIIEILAGLSEDQQGRVMSLPLAVSKLASTHVHAEMLFDFVEAMSQPKLQARILSAPGALQAFVEHGLIKRVRTLMHKMPESQQEPIRKCPRSGLPLVLFDNDGLPYVDVPSVPHKRIQKWMPQLALGSSQTKS